MKLTAATMIISRVCVYHFERFERALKNVSDEIRLYSTTNASSKFPAITDFSGLFVSNIVSRLHSRVRGYTRLSVVL